MTTSTPRAELAHVRAAAESVPDPELPVVTLGMLGIVEDVVVDDDGTVAVTLLPTLAGCPAQDYMGADVRDAVGALPGVEAVDVRFVHVPRWTSDRITPAGLTALAAAGIAPPAGDRSDTLVALGGLACPWCGSRETEQDSLFGPTPCRNIWFCRDCAQPFERFRRV